MNPEFTAEQQAGWWRALERHGGGSVCPICGRPRCTPYADAFAALIQLDLFHLGPPGQATATDRSPRVACAR